MGLIDTMKMRVDPTRFQGYVEGSAAPAAVTAHRPLVASAEKIKLSSTDDALRLRNRSYTEWQNEAWAYYDAIGEIKYGLGMLASVMSRIRLFPGLAIDPDSPPISTLNYRRRQVEQTEEEKAEDTESEMTLPPSITPEVMKEMERLVKNLFTGNGGSSGFMRAFALNLSVPGEAYLLEIKGKWYIKSTDEIDVDASGQIYLRPLRTQAGSQSSGVGQDNSLKLPRHTKIYRIWKEHPRYSQEPESSMMGLREVCDELVTLQRMIRTVARARMHAGVLFIPEDLSAAGSTIAEDVAEEEEALDELVSAIYDNITAPILDETSTASVAPTILTGPSESGKNILHIPIDRKVDQWLADRCDRALERILQGLDMPKDFVTGLANVRYTNAKNIDESLYKSHIEPMALMLCDALTSAYFQPHLKAKFPTLTQEDLETLTIWYDPSEIVTRADPADSADKGYDSMVLSADAWRQAHGYSDTDAPGEDELALRMLLASTLQPEQIGVLFKHLLPSVTTAQRRAHLEESPVPMDEKAQELLYGEVQVPNKDTIRNGATPTPHKEFAEAASSPAV